MFETQLSGAGFPWLELLKKMTPAFPLNPDHAWFSGYRISYDTFRQWVVTLPQPSSAPPHEPGNPHRRIYYFTFWLDWIGTLPIEMRGMAPRIRCKFLTCSLLQLTFILFFFSIEVESDVAVFFPLRWVDYRSKYQVEPGAPKYNPRICQEKESDRAKLENFLQLLQQQGAPLDKEKIQFGWQKEVHPRDEWRSVRFPPFLCLLNILFMT
jgi:hypothetical protein